MADVRFGSKADIDASLTVLLGNAACVAHQTTSRCKLAVLENCRHGIADRQCGEFFAAASKEHVANGHQSVCPQFVQRREGLVEIAFGAGLQDMNLQAERAGGRLQTFQKSIGIEICRVDEQSYDLGARDGVMQ